LWKRCGKMGGKPSEKVEENYVERNSKINFNQNDVEKYDLSTKFYKVIPQVLHKRKNCLPL